MLWRIMGDLLQRYDENTSIYTQPGFVPEDFHLIRTPAGFLDDLQKVIILLNGKCLIVMSLVWI